MMNRLDSVSNEKIKTAVKIASSAKTRKETGLFFNNYLTQHRICASIQLLLDTDLKINDIALAVGFSSPSYYISCFKKQTGLSPIKYRLKQF